MTIRPFVAGNYSANLNAQLLVRQRSSMDDLQRQLATKERSDSYAGLGVERVTSLEIRQRLSITDAYQSTITDVAQRLDFANNVVLKSMSKTSENFALQLGPSGYTTLQNGQPIASDSARLNLDVMLDALNSEYAGRNLFSGRASDTSPVLGSTAILEGDASGAGLRQLIAERRIADEGTGTGRTIIGGAGTAATWREDTAGHPFGLKFDTSLPAATRSTLSNATITGPAGSPAGISVNFSGQPSDGEKLVFQLRMPDSSVREVTLTANANTSAAASSDGFRIGATPAITAANLRAAMDLAARKETDSTLRGVSALEVSKDFFAPRPRANGNDFPTRIAGPVTATSTGFAADGTRPTVAYYRGEDTALGAATRDSQLTIRNSVTARIESGVSVAVGLRANEEPFSDVLAALAVFSVEDFKLPATATAEDRAIGRQRFEALAQRARDLLNGSDNGPTISSVQVELGTIEAVVKDAKERQKQRANIFTSIIQSIEGVNTEEVAAKALTLQNNLQASYQLTSIMSRLSLVDYLR
jgi:flagellar hook-associated protein 3 FlgL